MRKSFKIKVLCISDFFSPGFKGGGLIRTLENMIGCLHNQIEFWVFTRDRDLGDTSPYHNVAKNDWVSRLNSMIFYACPKRYGLAGIFGVMRSRSFDILYLNSFFSFKGSILPLLINSLFFRMPVILAPRGEFSSGALELKKIKKNTYLKFARLVGIYNKVNWQASSALELAAIRTAVNIEEGRIYVAPDLVAPLRDVEVHGRRSNKHESLRISFVSRIAEMKNLLFLLDVLMKVKSRVELSIYGPIEDDVYWGRCKDALKRLPSNIDAQYYGSVAPTQVANVFSSSDMFAFPTMGENFGHVIIEALRVGTPVLISDRTPWVAAPDAVTVIALENIDEWVSAIESNAMRSQSEYEQARRQTLDYASHYLNDDRAGLANISMFECVAGLK